MTVQAKKGDMVATRALYYDGTNKKLEVKWDAGEVVKVVQNNEVIGQLTAAASDDASTTLSGTLEKAPVTDKALYFYLHNTTRNYSSQNGTIEDISAYHDFAWGTVASGSFSVDGTKVTIPAGVSFDNTPQAIVKFTLLKFEDSLPLYTTELTICDDATQQNILKTFDHLNGATTKDDLTVTSSSATNVFYVALSDISGMMLNLFVNTGSKSYTYTKADVTFANGKYYEVSVKMADVHGLFSVCGGKKVYFCNGNVQFTGVADLDWKTGFAAQQSDVIGNNPGNTTINGNGSLSSYPGTVDLFGWSTIKNHIRPSFYGINNSTVNDKYAVSVSVFPHCSIARKLLPLHPCIKKCTIMDAKKDYSHVISGYRNELRLNGKATLSAYCRSVGVSISAVHHWMENYGITTKKIKAEMAELAGSDSPFVPLSSEMPVPVRSSGRIELTFPNGVLLSADQYPPQDLLVLLNGYRGGRV